MRPRPRRRAEAVQAAWAAVVVKVVGEEVQRGTGDGVS
jgi:hypothetical protein